jgi:hypothetical protein
LIAMIETFAVPDKAELLLAKSKRTTAQW